jgi:AbrB family looped-hinge helix DNA binding protein
MTLSEKAELSVGKRGEIYTTKEIREKLGLRPGEKALAHVEDNKLIIEPKPSALSLLRRERLGDALDPQEMSRHRGELSERLKAR